MVAGPDQIKAIRFSGILTGIRSGENKSGIGKVGRKARHTLIHHPGTGDRHPVRMHLRNPCAAESRHVKAAFEIEHGAHHFRDLHRFAAPVSEDHSADKGHLIQGEIQGKCRLLSEQRRCRSKYQFKRLTSPLCRGKRTGIGRRSVQHPEGTVDEIRNCRHSFYSEFHR